MDKKLEKLAELEHEQWVFWTRNLVKSLDKKEILSKKRLERWKKEWIPYKNLRDSTKDFDRRWAKRVIKVMKEMEDGKHER